jgi:branched-chain amino acid transport system permease protein
MDYYVEIFLSGLVSGLYYAALATALSLVFGINKIVNFAHGEFIMVGGFCYFFAQPFIGGIPAQLLGFIVSAAIAYVFHALILNRRLATSAVGFAPAEFQLITTFALGMLLLNIALVYFGPEIRAVAPPFSLPRIRTAYLNISSARLVGLTECVLFLVLTYALLMGTSIGRLLRAASQNPSAVATLGIDAERFDRAVFAGGCGLAGLAGSIIAPVFAVYPESGAAFVLKCFVVVVLGGFGSFPGTIVGGLLLGLVESFGGVFISTAYKDAFGFGLLLLVLFVRPQGLFGEKARGV